MTLAEAEDAIKTRFETEWAALDPEVAYAFDNEAFSAPVDLDTSWSRLVVQALPDAGATLGAIGSRRVTRRALAIVQVASPLDEGTAAARVMVALARSMFERATFDDIHGEDATVRPARNDGARWLTTVEIPLHYTETV